MNQVVPPRFLFRWSFDARRMDDIPFASGRLLDLPVSCGLPALEELEQRHPFGQVRLAWNDRGWGISLSVAGRTRRPECVIEELAFSDRIEVWLDTRNTQTAHRASKFCHHFALLPLGGGPKGLNPVARSLPVARARDEVQLPNADLIQIQSETTTNGYWLDAWFPAEVLVGFDPSTNPRIGFHYLLHDGELGDQSIAGCEEFPYDSDPSLWQTVALIT